MVPLISGGPPIPLLGVPLLAAALVALLLAAVHRVASRPVFVRFTLSVAAWLAAVGAASYSGALARFDARPPPVALLLLACLGAAAGLAWSPVGTALTRLPLAALVGFQAFRLPLEWVMHEAARQGLMPVQVSWSGLNFDVVSGASAVVVAALLASGRAGPRLALAWGVLGSALLAVIVGLAVASTPLIHAFGTSPDRLNTFIAEPPYTLLPTVMVVLALAGHLVLFRRLRRERLPASPGWVLSAG